MAGTWQVLWLIAALQATQPAVVRIPQPSAPSLGRVVFSLTAGTAFDSNIDHDFEPRDAYGGVGGLGLRFRDDPSDPSFELSYEAALHRYPDASQWNRISQAARLSWERDLGGPFKFGTVAEATFRGSSEDRELSNQFIAEPRLELRVSDVHRLRLFGAYRVKRYPDDVLRNAGNPMAGALFRQRGPRGDTWEIGARYDENRADGARFRYTRWTTETAFAAPIGRADRLRVELTMRFQRYAGRLVEVEDEDVPVLDTRWIPSVVWAHAIDDDFETNVEYQFENRQSNDPTRRFRSHLFGFRLVQRW